MNDFKLALLGERVLGRQSGSSRCILEEPVNWADGFVVVYNITDRLSFLCAKSITPQIKGSCEGILKQHADRRRYSGSKSMDNPINNAFNERRKVSLMEE